MKILTNALVISIIALTTSTSYSQISKKKYLRRNNKVESYKYGDSLIYSRGICTIGTKLFVGNSNGSLYFINTISEKSNIIFKQDGFIEMRDVEYVDDHIVGMQSGDKGQLVRINLNGGIQVIKEKDWDSLFFDAMDFHGNRGFLMADPTEGRFNLFHTNDGGLTWERTKADVPAMKEEAGFAASGTNVQVLNDSTYVFISGGEISKFYKSTNNGDSWDEVVLPYYPGKSTGPYSICFANDSIGVMVGGDYRDPAIRLNTSFYTRDGGESWFNSIDTPRGYRSCVFFKNNIFYACGRNGIDYSENNGQDWIPFADGTFFALTSIENNLIATERDGRIKIFPLIEQ